MRSLLIIPLLLLLGCGHGGTANTPEEAYFALNEAYIITLRGVVEYQKGCAPQPATHGCKAHVAKLQAGVAKTDRAFDAADVILAAKDEGTFALATASAAAALDALKLLLKEAYDGQKA